MFSKCNFSVHQVGDFGIARVLESTTAVAVTMLGTPYYMSPEADLETLKHRGISETLKFFAVRCNHCGEYFSCVHSVCQLP